MDEDLKIDVYQRVVNGVDYNEKEAVKKTACVLYAKKFANSMKEIHFYSSDFMGDGEDLFQMDYNVEYSNGEFQNGNCMVDTKDVLSAFGFADYEELKTYLAKSTTTKRLGKRSSRKWKIRDCHPMLTKAREVLIS